MLFNFRYMFGRTANRHRLRESLKVQRLSADLDDKRLILGAAEKLPIDQVSVGVQCDIVDLCTQWPDETIETAEKGCIWSSYRLVAAGIENVHCSRAECIGRCERHIARMARNLCSGEEDPFDCVRTSCMECCESVERICDSLSSVDSHESLECESEN
ncbi:hypothetical protein ACOME3_008498 [Neoechinorhynchus agilis]